MAKQSGIHQLRGKVGEMSYYKTKGIVEGIVRRINQGMAQRVKSGDEYANTRLNNSEFKNANALATAAFNSVNTRKRGMMRNFAVAQMTKRALEDIKLGTQSWGVRMPVTQLDRLFCDMLENYAKGGRYDGQFGSLVQADLGKDGDFNIRFVLTPTMSQSLVDLGVDGFIAVPSKCLAGETLVDDLPRLFAGNAIGAPSIITPSTSQDTPVSLQGTLATPGDVGMSPSGYEFAKTDRNHGFYVVVTFLPFRRVGSQQHTLQELCTFAAIPLGQIPE